MMTCSASMAGLAAGVGRSGVEALQYWSGSLEGVEVFVPLELEHKVILIFVVFVTSLNLGL